MPKPREKVGPLQGPPRLQPRATPVDTFHRPEEELRPQGPSEARQLAEALGRFQPTLYGIADTMQAEETQKQMSEGEKAILADQRLQNRKALKEAVDRGDIPAARNPWFLQGMRQQVYRLEAEKFDVALRRAYAESNSRNENDITDFIGSFTSKFMEGVDPADPEVARVLIPAVERSTGNLRNRHRAERDQAIEFEVEQNTETEIGLVLDRMDYGPPSEAQMEDTAKLIHGITQVHFENGLSGTRSNQIMARAIARKATESLDTSYLDLLDKIPTGPGGNLGQIGYVKDLRTQTEEEIYRKLEHNDRVQAKLAKDNKETVVNAGLTEGFNTILSDAKADIRPIMKKIAEVDPEAAQKLYGWQQSQIDGRDDLTADEGEEVRLTAKVYGGEGTVAEVIDAHREGKISSEVAKDLMKNLERSKEFRSPLREPVIHELHKAVGTAVRGNDATFTEAKAVLSARAQNEFLRMMINYKQTNPQASELETLKYARSVQEEIIKTFAPEAIDAAADATVLTPQSAMTLPPETVPWQTRPIFDEQAMTAAVAEYNASKGKSGVLVQMAQRLNIPAADLYRAQHALVLGPKKPKPKE